MSVSVIFVGTHSTDNGYINTSIVSSGNSRHPLLLSAHPTREKKGPEKLTHIRRGDRDKNGGIQTGKHISEIAVRSDLSCLYTSLEMC